MPERSSYSDDLGTARGARRVTPRDGDAWLGTYLEKIERDVTGMDDRLREVEQSLAVLIDQHKETRAAAIKEARAVAREHSKVSRKSQLTVGGSAGAVILFVIEAMRWAIHRFPQ